MKDFIARFMKTWDALIARFKKAWAAFVRTWNFEKDVGSTTERVRKEVEYAIECEKKEATEDNDYAFLDYFVECCRSALRAYETMAADGHSGMSWGLTRQIFSRLAEGKPLRKLNSYEDHPEEWKERSDWTFLDGIVFGNTRYPSLTYRVSLRDEASYRDIDRWVFEEIDNPHTTWNIGLLANYLDEKFPIKFPYTPQTIHVRIEELLTDPAHGDYDAQRIIDFVDPETGEVVKVDACFAFSDEEDKMVEVGKKKWYALRRKHAERLATALAMKGE